MRSTLFSTIAACVAAAVLINGCSSRSETSEASNSKANNTTIIVPKEDNSKNPYGSNANSNNVVPYNGAANLNGNPTLDNSKVTIVDTKEVKPTMPTRQLAENSVLTTEMNSKGHVIETRTFKGDQAVRKIEKVTVTPEDVTMKVYLKNGKVKTLPAGKLLSLSTVTVAQILEAVGEKIPVPEGKPGKTKQQILKEREGKNPN